MNTHTVLNPATDLDAHPKFIISILSHWGVTDHMGAVTMLHPCFRKISLGVVQQHRGGIEAKEELRDLGSPIFWISS